MNFRIDPHNGDMFEKAEHDDVSERTFSYYRVANLFKKEKKIVIAS